MQFAERLRKRTYEVLEVSRSGDSLSRAMDVMIVGLVAGNVLAVILESISSIARPYHDLFIGFEKISIAAFSAEFICRFWATVENPLATGSASRKRLDYLLSPMAIIDLLAIAPFFLSALFALDLRVLRILRILRVVKLTRYSAALGSIREVYTIQRNALTTSFFLMGIAVILSASLLHVVESHAQPDAFGSIPAAMWWAICTLTTVGYGDVAPITPLGKLVASSITVVGIGMVALPTSIFASGFVHVMERNERQLTDEAEDALADGVIDAREAHAYEQLAESLFVEPELAREVIEMVRKRQDLADSLDCPHCGKSLG